MAATRVKRLTPDDLSNQEGVFYVGRAPKGETVSLWSFSHAVELPKRGKRYLFEDCMSPCEHPYVVAFSLDEVELRLRLVGRQR